MITQVLVLATGGSIFVLLILKMAEILDLVLFVRRRGSAFAEALTSRGVHEGVLRVEEVKAVMREFDYPKKGPRGIAARHLNAIRPRWLAVGLLRVFRFHYLLPLLAFASLVTSSRTPLGKVALTLYVALLVASCVVQAFNLVLHEYEMGYADLIQKTVGLHQEREDLEPVLAPNQFLRDFLALLVRTLLAFVVAYGAIYWALERLRPGSFQQLRGGVQGIIDAFYYSLATITTTGAGPIAPRSVLAEVLAATEIAVGVTLLVFRN
jgi:Ion channel